LVQSSLIAPLLKIARVERAALLTAKRLPFTKRARSIEPEEIA